MHTLGLTLEVYYRHREQTINIPMRLDVGDDVTSIADIMAFAHNRINEVMTDNREPHMLIVDERYNYHCLYKEDIQAVNIYAPDQESITWGPK